MSLIIDDNSVRKLRTFCFVIETKKISKKVKTYNLFSISHGWCILYSEEQW